MLPGLLGCVKCEVVHARVPHANPRAVPEVDRGGDQRVWLDAGLRCHRVLAFLCGGACGLVVRLPGATLRP
jgi:hypothetical protein